MNHLNLASNLARPDDFYADWLAAHEGLSEGKSHDLNAAIVLLLANHIGDIDVLKEALSVARAAVEPQRV